MNPNWRSFLESAEATFSGDGNELIDFGHPANELQAATRQTVVVPLTHLALIDARGDDAKSFLHSQLTNDINHLADGQAQHAGWCNAKGRMQASFLVWRRGADYRLMLANDLREVTQKRLQMFVLRAKVKLLAEESLVLIGVAGSQAVEVLSDAGLPCPAAPLSTQAQGEIDVVRLDKQRYLLAVPVAQVPDLWQKLTLKAMPAGVPAWRWLDVQAAYPLVSLATKEEFVPQMADFDQLGGISFHKGCYPGQEIVARTQYLGKVKRHLYRVRCTAPLQAGDELHSPENPETASGKIMSAAPAPDGSFVALAVVQANFAGSLHLGARDGVPVVAEAVNPV